MSADPIVRFDGKRTPWRVRAEACDGRYQVATCSMFGKVHYTVIDHQEQVRGPLNVIGGGMGIFTTKGPDGKIDEVVAMLEGRYPDGIALGTWEVSHRNRVTLVVTR